MLHAQNNYFIKVLKCAIFCTLRVFTCNLQKMAACTWLLLNMKDVHLKSFNF